MRSILCTLWMAIAIYGFGQPTTSTSENLSQLSIPQIMQGEKFVGYLPENIFWSEDSRWIYFSWNPEMDTLRSLYKINKDGGDPKKVLAQEEKALPAVGGAYNKGRTQKTYVKNGDIFLMDLVNHQIQQITHTIDIESNVRFSGNEQEVIFQRDNNLYAWHIQRGSIRQLTNFVKGNKKKEKKNLPYEVWLENDQLTWVEVLRERKNTKETRERREKTKDTQRPAPIYYGDKQLSNIQISPNLKFVTYRLTQSPKRQSTQVPYFVTETGKTEVQSARSKVGAPQSTYEMGVYDVENDSSYIVDTKQIEGIYDKAAFLKAYHKGTTAYNDKYEEPRAVLIHGPFFSDDSKAVVVVRSIDNKDRWIMRLSLQSGVLKLLDRQQDDAWIGGPGISGWNFSAGNMGWIDDNTIWFQSEETGFSHLYSLDVRTATKTSLTKGPFEIIDAYLSKNKRYFYITSNKESPHEKHFYRMDVKGGDMTRISDRLGNYQVTMSPDERYLAVRYSYSNQPWELYVMVNSPKAKMEKLTHSTTESFKEYDWREPSIVWITASDGAKVPARLYRPDSIKNNGAAVIFVHGAGYLQNVHQWWSSYYREYMFHNFLADNGYTVMDIDYRASAGYGRDWRTATYQYMGGKDLSDQVDGAQFLVEEYGVDAKRIGIYGGSYGGFITLMALFNSPGTFKSGAALRSVTDWAHYNHPYTSNILNTPAEDSLAYYRSSPIYHAEGLQDHLLILHGMVDRNVQFQDVVRLAQRLIELGKDNWELAVFPVEGHGFVEANSWADEYKRIFKLFQETLRE